MPSQLNGRTWQGRIQDFQIGGTAFFSKQLCENERIEFSPPPPGSANAWIKYKFGLCGPTSPQVSKLRKPPVNPDDVQTMRSFQVINLIEEVVHVRPLNY